MLSKQELRKTVKLQRSKLSRKTLRDISDRIFKNLINHPWYLEARIIHCFASIEKNNEVETHKVLEQILSDGKTLVMSKIVSRTDLNHFKVDSLSSLVDNNMGIPEPESGEFVEAQDLDLIIIPALACDRNGNRLGYGAGYYDRFLSRTSAKKLALCPHQFLIDSIPVEKHDQNLDAIITESDVLIVNS